MRDARHMKDDIISREGFFAPCAVYHVYGIDMVFVWPLGEPFFPTLSKKPQKSHQKGMELPDPCRYFLCKLCGVLVAYFVLL